MVVQPAFQPIEDRRGFRPTDLDTPVGRRLTRLLLDRIKLRDPPDGLLGDGRPLGPVDVDELAPDMGMQATS